jgi:hypothetical protein
MKNIAIAFLTILLWAAPSVHAQQIADVPTKNSCVILTPVVETMNTFVPDRPSRVQQDSISHVMGTVTGNGVHVPHIGQITITSGSIWFTQDDHTPISSNWTFAGENTILTNNTYPVLVNGPSTPPANPVDISNNWWGFSPPAIGWNGYNGQYTSEVNFTSSSIFLPSAPSCVDCFTCGSLFDLVGNKGMVPQSLPFTIDSPCTALERVRGL